MTTVPSLEAPKVHRPLPVPTINVELTCTREPGHVHYSVPPEALPELRGMLCPTCRLGVLDLCERTS